MDEAGQIRNVSYRLGTPMQKRLLLRKDCRYVQRSRWDFQADGSTLSCIVIPRIERSMQEIGGQPVNFALPGRIVDTLDTIVPHIGRSISGMNRIYTFRSGRRLTGA